MYNCLLKVKRASAGARCHILLPFYWSQACLEHVLCFNRVWSSAYFTLRMHLSLLSLLFGTCVWKASAGLRFSVSLLLVPVSAHPTFISLAILHVSFEWLLWLFLLWLIYISVSVDWSINLNSYVPFPSVNKGKSI